MHQLVHYPSSHPYLTLLQQHKAYEGWEWIAYSGLETISSETQVFILVSPLMVGEKIIAPDFIWKQYLQQHQPQLKFLNVSIYPNDHPNHLFLFDLPHSFTEKFQNALTLNVDWEPFVFGGIDARNYLKDFIHGHGGMSFYKPLYRLYSLIKDIFAEKADGIAYLETWTELGPDTLTWWNALCTRWRLYQDFFTILPLDKEVTIIETKLQQIEPFFAGQGAHEHLLYESQCDNVLQSIIQIIKTLESYASH